MEQGRQKLFSTVLKALPDDLAVIVRQVLEEAEQRRRAEITQLPLTTTDSIFTKACSPLSRYKGEWILAHVQCPLCNKHHTTVITGARKPRKSRLDDAYRGLHISRCPNQDFEPFRVLVRGGVPS